MLILASVAVAPRIDDPANVTMVLAAYAEDEVSVRISSVSGAAGAWALVLGFANVHHFIGTGSGAAWGRLGFYGLILGAAGVSAAAGLRLGGVAVSDVLPDLTPGTSATAEALISFAGGAWMLGQAAIWSALIMIGIAWTRTDLYARKWSWPLLILGLALASIAWVRLVVGFDATLEAASDVATAVLGLWAVAAGATAARKAW